MRRVAAPGDAAAMRLLALGHTLVGLVLYRRELGAIVRDGILDSVPDRGPKATAFWFLVPSPLIWIVGSLIGRAEKAGDARALRDAHRAGLLSAALAAACMPVSGFWIWLAISARGLRDANRGLAATRASAVRGRAGGRGSRS